jgi:hypothetical protein
VLGMLLGGSLYATCFRCAALDFLNARVAARIPLSLWPLVMILLISLVNADGVWGTGMEADGFTVAFSDTF